MARKEKKIRMPVRGGVAELISDTINDTIMYYRKKALSMPRNIEHEEKMYAAFFNNKK